MKQTVFELALEAILKGGWTVKLKKTNTTYYLYVGGRPAFNSDVGLEHLGSLVIEYMVKQTFTRIDGGD